MLMFSGGETGLAEFTANLTTRSDLGVLKAAGRDRQPCPISSGCPASVRRAVIAHAASGSPSASRSQIQSRSLRIIFPQRTSELGQTIHGGASRLTNDHLRTFGGEIDLVTRPNSERVPDFGWEHHLRLAVQSHACHSPPPGGYQKGMLDGMSQTFSRARSRRAARPRRDAR